MDATIKTDAVGGAPRVAGLHIRPYAGEADVPDIVRLENLEWEADGVRGRVSVDSETAFLRHPSEQFDPARDVWLAELEGRPIAVTWCDWVDATDGVRAYRSRCWVDPAVRRRGIGTALLAHSTARVRELAGSQATERPKMLEMFTPEGSLGGQQLARRSGYEPVRWFFDMERRIDGELPAIEPLPDGLELRPVDRDDGMRIWAADHEAFRDHWGGHDDSEANFRRWSESPEFDPSLFVVAFDGDEIAGAVLNAIYPEENEALGIRRGWLDGVFTRRAWRRRGLARALIVRSLHLLRERGMDLAVLGVDADNPSGALGLYESAGFAVTEKTIAWRRPLEDLDR